MTHNQAKKEGHKVMASLNLWNTRKRIDNILNLNLFNEVRVIQKKDNKTKGYMPK